MTTEPTTFDNGEQTSIPESDLPSSQTPAVSEPASPAAIVPAESAEAPLRENHLEPHSEAAPAHETPVAEPPTAVGPTTEAPAVEAPAVEAPAVEAPAAEAPAVEAPAVEAPAAEAPAAVAAPETPTAPAGSVEAVVGEQHEEIAAEGAVEGEEAEGGEAQGPRKKSRRKPRLTNEEAQPIWDALKAAFDAQDVVQMHAVRSIPGGMIVSYQGLEGFVPRSQFLLEGRAEGTDMESFVGQDLPLVVIEMTDFEKRRFVCSRKKALKRERFAHINKGDVLEGTVASITSYGVFVDLGGIDGLIHISRLSKVRVNRPDDVVKVHEKIKVRVVEVDPKAERIALSMKEFTESPWTHAAEKFPVGSTHKGKVRNVTDFGVYIQLEAGIVGMVHISDLSWTRRLQHPSEVVRIGQELEVKVLENKANDKRIALSVKDTLPDPWPRLANIYHVGAEASGTIKRVMDAGAIVSLDFDVDCFVPRGKMGAMRRGKGPRDAAPAFAVGDTVQVKVIEMDSDKRSFICAIVREDIEESRSQNQRPSFEHKATASERAFTLGEIDALKNYFSSQTAEQNEPATETEAVTVDASGETAGESAAATAAVINETPEQNQQTGGEPVTELLAVAPVTEAPPSNDNAESGAADPAAAPEAGSDTAEETKA